MSRKRRPGIERQGIDKHGIRSEGGPNRRRRRPLTGQSNLPFTSLGELLDRYRNIPVDTNPRPLVPPKEKSK